MNALTTAAAGTALVLSLFVLVFSDLGRAFRIPAWALMVASSATLAFTPGASTVRVVLHAATAVLSVSGFFIEVRKGEKS